MINDKRPLTWAVWRWDSRHLGCDRIPNNGHEESHQRLQEMENPSIKTVLRRHKNSASVSDQKCRSTKSVTDYRFGQP
jgi:hypothetical protein